MEPVISEHIEITEGVCGGRPRVAGHRIRVMDVAACHKLGMTPDEILVQYPSLTLGDVHAALAYYFDHRDEIERALDHDRCEAERLRAEAPGPLIQKLERLRAERDSVSSR